MGGKVGPFGLGRLGVVLVVAAIFLLAPSMGSTAHAIGPTLPIPPPVHNHRTGVTIPGGNGPSGVTFDPVNGELYVADFGSSNVSVINTTTNHIVAQIPLSYGLETIVTDTATGVVYTANTFSTVYAISPVTNQVAWTTSVAAAGCPTGCAPKVQTYDSANGDIYVTDLATDYASVIHGSAVVATIPVGMSPNGATYDSANGEVYVANEGSLNLTVIDGATNTVTGDIATVSTGPGLAYDGANGNVYLCSNAAQAGQSNFVTVINGTTNKVAASIRVVDQCGGAVYDPEDGYVYMTNPYEPGSEAFLSSVSLFDPVSNQVVLTLPVESAPIGIAYDSVNDKVYVANLESNTISILPQLYLLTVHETGLPSGTDWSATLGGVTVWSTSSTITLPEPSGTFNFTIGQAANLSANPSSGSVEISGGPGWLNVTFSKGGGGGLLGLPGTTGYYVLVGIGAIAAILVGVFVVLTRRKRRAKPLAVVPPGRAP